MAGDPRPSDGAERRFTSIEKPEALKKDSDTLRDRLRGKADARRPSPRSGWSRLTTGIAAPALPVLLAVPIVAVLFEGWPRLLALVALVAVAVNFAVYWVTRVTESAGWYALAVFLSVCIVGGGAGIIRTKRAHKVEPVAFVRKGEDAAVCGVFVAQNDKRLYVGNLRHDAEGPHLPEVPGNVYWVRTDEIELVKVGRYVESEKALDQAEGLASQLHADRTEVIPKPLASTKKTQKDDTAKTETTTEEPAAFQHPKLRTRPPGAQLCIDRKAAPMRSVTYDP